jgi:hypothetical protein
MSVQPTHSYSPIENQGSQDNALASSLMSSRVPKGVPTLNRIVSVPSQSGNASAGGTLQFQVPGGSNSNGYLRSNSAYIRGVCTVAGLANTNADIDICFANQVASASSLINRFQLSANSTQLEVINRYDNYHAIIEAHSMSAPYFTNDSSIVEYSNSRIVNGTTATSAVFNFCIPLASAVLSNVKSFPLFLSNLFIQLDLNSVGLAFKVGGTGATAPSNYTLSQVELVYELIQPDYSLLDAMRLSMSQNNKMFEMPMTCALGLTSSQQANVSSFSYNVGLNLASVEGVLIAEIATTAGASNSEAVVVAPANASCLTNLNSFIRNSTEANTNYRRIFIDSKQLISYDVWADSQNFLECQRTLGMMLDPALTTIATRANYCNAGVATGSYYVVGQSSNRFSESDLCMTGTPCQNLVIQLGKTGTTVATNYYIYILYDQVVVFDANGSVGVAK